MRDKIFYRLLCRYLHYVLALACLVALCAPGPAAGAQAAARENSAAAPQGTRIFVNKTATGSNNGTTWANAFNSLQSALDVAVAGDEIWVATGIYTPTFQTMLGDERSATFVLESGLELYGGFVGNETDLSQRDWRTYPTVLSGDQAQDDGGEFGFDNGEDNSYHVIIGSGTLESAVLNGFIVRDGNATGSDPDDKGGGIYNDSGSLRVVNVIFQNNHANQGGGMYNTAASPKLINVAFVGNRAVSGGALFNTQSSSLTLVNALFAGNGSIGSVITSLGGGIRNANSSATLINCVFSNNKAAQGGGISNLTSSIVLENATISGNEATTFNGGGGIVNSNTSTMQMENSIVWGNINGQVINQSSTSTQTIRQSLVQSGCPSSTTCNGTILLVDPRFVDADGFDNQAGTADDNLRPSIASPAIDAGDNSLVPVDSLDLDGDANTSELLPYDFDERPRQSDFPFVTDSGLGTPPIVDMGAYEARRIFVDASANGGNDGKTWDSAFTSLQSALDQAVIGDEIWVADGIYKPSQMTNPPNTRSATFKLKRGVAIYGGFSSGENSRMSRNWRTYPAILSGDLNGNDVGFTNNGENSYHVVVIQGMDRSTILDGFVLRGGNANGSGDAQYGGGVWNNMANPSLVNLTFEKNYAAQGGGTYNNLSNAPLIVNCGWFGNQALFGAGMRNFGSSPTVVNAIFSGNSVIGAGAGIYNTASSPNVVNATFAYNTAPLSPPNSGGGMLSDTHPAYGPSAPTMSNSILWGNVGGQLVNSGSGTGTIFTYGLIQGGCTPGTTCLGNLWGGDPLFVDVDGLDNLPGTLDDDLRVQFGSEAIDGGDNDPLPPDTLDLDGDGDTLETISLDPLGVARRIDLFDYTDTGHGEKPIVDIGAYEYLPQFWMYLPLLRK